MTNLNNLGNKTFLNNLNREFSNRKSQNKIIKEVIDCLYAASTAAVLVSSIYFLLQFFSY